MGLATFFVLLGSSTLIATFKSFIPKEVRISAYILVIATFVTIADLVLNAVVPEIHRALGAFIALIVVNCIILGRQEAFASKNPLLPSLADAAGMGLGFGLALFIDFRVIEKVDTVFIGGDHELFGEVVADLFAESKPGAKRKRAHL